MSRSLLKGFLVATVIALGLGSPPAKAAIVDQGVLNAGDSRTFPATAFLYPQGTNFDDQYRFSVNQISGVTLVGTRQSSEPLPPAGPSPVEIQGFEVGLYRLDPGDTLTLLQPAGLSGDVFTLNYAGLTTGATYLFRATGLVTGLFGTYNGTYTVAAVPLPPAIILLGSALFGLALFGRLRRSMP